MFDPKDTANGRAGRVEGKENSRRCHIGMFDPKDTANGRAGKVEGKENSRRCHIGMFDPKDTATSRAGSRHRQEARIGHNGSASPTDIRDSADSAWTQHPNPCPRPPCPRR